MTVHNLLHDVRTLILRKILQFLESQASFWYMIWWVSDVMFPTKSERKVSQPRKKSWQSLNATVLQAQYLRRPGEESRRTSAISCATWLGPSLSWRALWGRLLRSSRTTQLSASQQPWELQNLPPRRLKTALSNNEFVALYPHPPSKLLSPILPLYLLCRHWHLHCQFNCLPSKS